MRNKLLITAMLLLSLMGIGWANQGQTSRAFEYKILYKIDEKKANALGSEGWEMVAIGAYGGDSSMVGEYVFKRPKN